MSRMSITMPISRRMSSPVRRRISILLRILGIDPGSRVTGFGVIETGSNGAVLVAHGCVRQSSEATFPARLGKIFSEIGAVIAAQAPDEMAIEDVFVSRNPSSALKLGQARGAAICAAASVGLGVWEYTPAKVKQAIVGRGRAEKRQIQHMVAVLLGIRDPLQADAADALGVALCHLHHRQSELRAARVRR